MYHRITSLDVDPFHLAVTPEHFEQHLQVLLRDYDVLRLADLPARIAAQTLPPRGVVITFDDGYSDLFQLAHPLLKKYGCPATAFITSGFVESSGEAWWDELEEICYNRCSSPRDRTRVWEWLASWSSPGPVRLWRRRYSHWLNRNEDQVLYQSLYHALRQLPAAARDRKLSELAAYVGTTRSARQSHRMISARELLALTHDGLWDIGAHTVSHPQLSLLPPEEQRQELQQSKLEIEEITGRPVFTFAYPFGSRGDYTSQSVELAREVGFSMACAGFPGVVQNGAGCYELQRHFVLDWDGRQFSKELEAWWRA